MLATLRARGALTRQELGQLVGLSRATIVERLDVLSRLKLIRTIGFRESSGGRPAELLVADDVGRVTLAVDIGANHAAVAVADLRGTVIDLQRSRLPARHSPQRTVEEAISAGQQLLRQTGRADDLCAVGVSVPGQIDHNLGTTVAPPPMPGWTAWPLRDAFADALGVPVLLENDANALTFGEYRTMGNPTASVVGVTVSLGIGAGVVLNGRPYQGITSCAGEIGHIRVEGREERCDCGRRGCVAAIASGRALVRQLRDAGARSLSDVLRRITAGDDQAVRLTADAGWFVGTVLATVVSIINPGYIRVGGTIGAQPPFLTGLREAVTAQAHPIALTKLSVELAQTGENAMLVGLAGLVADAVFAPTTVNELAARL